MVRGRAGMNGGHIGEDERVEALLAAEAPYRTFLVENPLTDRVLHVPPLLRVRAGRIEWSLGDAADGWWREGWSADRMRISDPLPSPRLSCLSQFVRLADEFDERMFLLFAQRFGVLGLCPVPEGARINGIHFGDPSAPEHWYPGVRDGGIPPLVDPEVFAHERWYWEPIAGWRAYAKEAQSVLNLARDARLSQTREANPSPPNELAARYSPYPEDETVVLPMIIRSWLANAGITISFVWPRAEGPKLVLSTGGIAGPNRRQPVSGALLTDPLAQLGWPLHNLFGTLALQLAGALCADDRLVQCAKCGRIFMHEGAYRPRYDRPHYCSDPCRQDARRETMRKSAAKSRAAKKGAKREMTRRVDSHRDSQGE